MQDSLNNAKDNESKNLSFDDLFSKITLLTQSLSQTQDVSTKLSIEANKIADEYRILKENKERLEDDIKNLQIKIEDEKNNISTHIKEDINKIKGYIQEFGIKDQNIEIQVSEDFKELTTALKDSLNRIEENLRTNLFSKISTALEENNTDTLPPEFIQIIHEAVINRIEKVVKSFEDLSHRYMSGEISHEEFTNLLSKNALWSLLREKVVDDITREIENNNLESNILPSRMKVALKHLRNESLNQDDLQQAQSTYRFSEEENTSSDSINNNQYVSSSVFVTD